MSENYKIRYRVDQWGKPVPGVENACDTGIDGVKVVDDNYGYADDILLASVMYTKDRRMSIFLLSSEVPEDGTKISRDLLLAVRGAIDHHLEHHCKG